MGIVENMAWFSPVPHPDEKYFIFGKGGGELLAKETNTQLLGQIPLTQVAAQTPKTDKYLLNNQLFYSKIGF